jgi:hypothetical protein
MHEHIPLSLSGGNPELEYNVLYFLPLILAAATSFITGYSFHTMEIRVTSTNRIALSQRWR